MTPKDLDIFKIKKKKYSIGKLFKNIWYTKTQENKSNRKKQNKFY